LDNERFFILGRLQIAVRDDDEPFVWLAWVEINADDFDDICEKWSVEGRESMPPYQGFLANRLPSFSESTLNLRVTLKTSPLPDRPLIQVIDYHQLLDEQTQSISQERVHEIAAFLMH
jgi:hypothetical protein